VPVAAPNLDFNPDGTLVCCAETIRPHLSIAQPVPRRLAISREPNAIPAGVFCGGHVTAREALFHDRVKIFNTGEMVEYHKLYPCAAIMMHQRLKFGEDLN
jgi:hypothetical protein